MKFKDPGIEALRGLAIILMVAGHVIGGTESRGLHVAEQSWWRYYYVAFADIRMPLFTMLSGYVYALRPITQNSKLRTLYKGKAKRLLIPCVTVGSIFFIMQTLVPGTNTSQPLSDMWKVYVYGIEFLWFVQAVFLIFLVVGLLDKRQRLIDFKLWLIFTLFAALMYIVIFLPSDWAIFSVDGAIRLLPFFLLGLGLRRFRANILTPRVVAWATVCLIVGFALRTVSIISSTYEDSFSNRLLAVIVGTSSVIVLFSVKRLLINRYLCWLGGYSFGIYLLHTFANSGSRIILEHLGITSTPLLFIVCLSCGIIAPVIFEITLGRSKIISRAILGQGPTQPKSALVK